METRTSAPGNFVITSGPFHHCTLCKKIQKTSVENLTVPKIGELMLTLYFIHSLNSYIRNLARSSIRAPTRNGNSINLSSASRNCYQVFDCYQVFVEDIN